MECFKFWHITEEICDFSTYGTLKWYDGKCSDFKDKKMLPSSLRVKMWRANLCATFLGNLVYPTPASKMLHFP